VAGGHAAAQLTQARMARPLPLPPCTLPSSMSRFSLQPHRLNLCGRPQWVFPRSRTGLRAAFDPCRGALSYARSLLLGDVWACCLCGALRNCPLVCTPPPSPLVFFPVRAGPPRTADHARSRIAVLVEVLRELGGLARARLSDDHDNLVLRDHLRARGRGRRGGEGGCACKEIFEHIPNPERG